MGPNQEVPGLGRSEERSSWACCRGSGGTCLVVLPGNMDVRSATATSWNSVMSKGQSLVRTGRPPRSGSSRGRVVASTLGAAAEKMAGIMTRPGKCRYWLGGSCGARFRPSGRNPHGPRRFARTIHHHRPAEPATEPLPTAPGRPSSSLVLATLAPWLPRIWRWS
jgi:hypothetical protein